VISIKKITVLIIIILLSSKGSAEIKDSLYATIGSKPVTEYDIIKEIKTILILNGQSFQNSQKTQIQSVALDSIIKRNIKKIEIEKFGNLPFNKDDVDSELHNMSSRLNISVESFENIFSANDIDFNDFKDQIILELQWNTLIYELYKDRLSINLNEIDEQLEVYKDKKEIEEYLLSEIIIKQVSQNEYESRVKEVMQKINDESFENTAMDISISKTAINGGDLGWVNENIISESLRGKIINTSVGNISEPIILPEGILFFKVRDKRKVKNSQNIEDVKQMLIEAEKTKVLNMHSLSHFENLRRSTTITYY